MTCEVIKLPDGGRAIVCGPRRPPRRCRCGAIAEFECDHPTRRGTCDAAICARCATETGQDRHACPKHKEAARQGSLAL